MSVTQSPPSASITATSLSTRPGSCAERRSRDPANAPDNAPVSPTRSANSTNNATPACDTSPSPSAVTSTVPRRASGFTNWVSSWVACRDFSNPDSHGPGGRSGLRAQLTIGASRLGMLVYHGYSVQDERNKDYLPGPSLPELGL